MFVETQRRWHICAEGLKQPVLFSDPVSDATAATLVTAQFQFVPFSAKFKSVSNENGVSWMYARQLQCTPLRATVEAVMGARHVGTPVHRGVSPPNSPPPKMLHPLTEKIRGFLQPEQFLEKVVSTVILESKFSGSNSDEGAPKCSSCTCVCLMVSESAQLLTSWCCMRFPCMAIIRGRHYSQ